ncbi:hypothetical protein ACXY7D_03915 [Sphingomonas melonis]|jgi:hypothetical protein|uniref:Uncharacterized protein n=2 Tax=Sphingomonas TaxID=13687 RepID=A0A175Y7X9_9SPHN|nr:MULTISPECIES: hypothetical protein [Sphingomonas]AOW24216.1 hypothetical protein BJP26_12065 [Sphingomonas melonis TY]ATI55266.1 hypothetical protein CP552_06055 [Sphingomonas melonis]KZB96379.1 hypothetical protein AVM11_13215 [Sphingomonas melonis TY]MBI0531544.1 hypothetical protein [Sphingomonas sp. TX0522]MBX8843716.1 hypothetical protein [Sphingomonas melonis]
MPRESLIMFAVAAVLGLAGLWLLLQLRSPQGPARVYVYRMAGIMMVAGGIVLGFSAYAMWQWSAQP